jgi:spermidine dehydrogenase
MADSKVNESGDDALGLNAPIDRRDLLNSTLLAAGSMLLGSVAPFQLLAEEEWTGYGGVGDYARSNGNTYEVMTDGHKIRDHVYERASTDAIDTGEEFDCVM